MEERTSSIQMRKGRENLAAMLLGFVVLLGITFSFSESINVPTSAFWERSQNTSIFMLPRLVCKVTDMVGRGRPAFNAHTAVSGSRRNRGSGKHDKQGRAENMAGDIGTCQARPQLELGGGQGGPLIWPEAAVTCVDGIYRMLRIFAPEIC